MKILGIETAFGYGRMALVEDFLMLAEEGLSGQSRQSSGLLPLLDDLLSQVNWKVGELELIGVGTGPGSFTGLRVGAAVGQGLAFALGIPLFGIPSFAALAASETSGEISVVSDARRFRAYAARYLISSGYPREICAPSVISFEDIPSFCSGSKILSPHPGALGDHTQLELIQVLPQPVQVARLALQRLDAGDQGDPADIRPIYLGSNYRTKGGIPYAP